jgi:hypothetical protein
MVIENSNGKSYRVLKMKQDYMLLLDNKNDELVIAYKYNEKSKCWASANYYGLCSLKDVIEIFEMK